MIQIQSTANVAANGQKFLVYGGAGVGKTPLCATLQPWSPIILSAESGLLSLRQYNLPFVEINSVPMLTEAYNWFATSQEAKQFGACCLDSISEMGEVILAKEKAATKDPRKAYGEMMEQIVVLAKKFRDLPGRHIYISCKEEYVSDEASGTSHYTPMMPGKKLGPQLPYFFDYVFRMKRWVDPVSKQDCRALQCKPTFDAVARDRSGVLQEFESADLGAIINKLQ
jgi:hypothetical protein